jgi:hypothetical protein
MGINSNILITTSIHIMSNQSPPPPSQYDGGDEQSGQSLSTASAHESTSKDESNYSTNDENTQDTANSSGQQEQQGESAGLNPKAAVFDPEAEPVVSDNNDDDHYQLSRARVW